MADNEEILISEESSQQQCQLLSLGISACKLIYKRLAQNNLSISLGAHKACGSKFPKGPI